MKQKILTITFFLIYSMVCYAQEDVDLGQIVVTPYYGGNPTSMYTIPYSINVLTNTYIKTKGATNILELLKSQPGINISDWYGTGVKANLDLMGFGDNALSNILVLVNGRRVNDIDLSGIDWTQIPLDNIEKIEIIKGGGTVLYGDNSCGGIINIITRKPEGNNITYEIKSEGGSYSYDKEAFTLSNHKDALDFYVYTEHYSTDGYRRNSHYRSRYVNINVDAQVTENTGISLEGGHHRYRYGLPGALYESDLSSGFTRRDSKYPNDNSRMEDNYIATSLTHKFSEETKFIMGVSYRNKNGVDNWLSYGGWDSIVDKHITTMNITNRLFTKLDFFNTSHNIIGGLEIFHADFSADTDDLSIFNSDNYTDIDRNYSAIFVNDAITLTENITVTTGIRIQKENFEFDYYSSSLTVDDKLHFREESYEAGINYRINNTNNVFLNFSRGFRIPKTDEYFSAFATPPVNKNLRPQISKTVIAGMNTNFTKNIIAGFDIFIMNIEDEIYYDPLTFSNANYQKTRHRGIDVQLKFTPNSRTEYSLGYRATNAEFRKGPYNGKEIPAVPHSKLTLSLTHHFPSGIIINLDTSYRSKVYLINDLNNSLDKLKSFWVTNVKLQYKRKNVELYVGIKNLFNELYSEYAATNSTGTVKALYPSPERNYFWGIKINF